ncbi:MAM domain-containing glycosylphosphatidylinositol anchor protein 2-like [Argopecten irradians]|uniref:MAM domain-containing glycosylphosphatidylinositol anchor protein 2-like n=1 Tax=Argopecten irradians TaxID=31199 RepID=UPI00371D1A79
MYGRNMGTLNVFVRDETGANIVSWSKSGNQGNRWHETGINISSPVPSSRKIIFEGHRKCDITGDVAIDDITLTSGSCVDGSWATWRTWSSCTVVNKDARRSRCRRCTNPFGQDGSASCSGESLQSEHCPVPTFTFHNYC